MRGIHCGPNRPPLSIALKQGVVVVYVRDCRLCFYLGRPRVATLRLEKIFVLWDTKMFEGIDITDALNFGVMEVAFKKESLR